MENTNYALGVLQVITTVMTAFIAWWSYRLNQQIWSANNPDIILVLPDKDDLLFEKDRVFNALEKNRRVKVRIVNQGRQAIQIEGLGWLLNNGQVTNIDESRVPTSAQKFPFRLESFGGYKDLNIEHFIEFKCSKQFFAYDTMQNKHFMSSNDLNYLHLLCVLIEDGRESYIKQYEKLHKASPIHIPGDPKLNEEK